MPFDAVTDPSTSGDVSAAIVPIVDRSTEVFRI